MEPNGTIASRTRMGYDFDTPLTATSVTVGRAPTGDDGVDPRRGNVTRLQQWLASEGRWLTSLNWYDDLGNLVQSRDPMGRDTFYNYSDAWEPSAPCLPPSPVRAFSTRTTNHLGHFSERSYYSCSSLVRTIRDFNLHTTVFAYDRLERLKQVDAPDGGQHQRFYSDLIEDLSATRNGPFVFRDRILALPLRSKSFTKIEGVLDQAELTILDGLGRIEMQGSKNGVDSLGDDRFDFVLFEYDGNGRRSSVSNPLSIGGSTDIPSPAAFQDKTVTFFDALDRVVQVVTPNSQAAVSSYDGNRTTVTDQAGVSRRSTADGLGRVVEVREADPATGALSAAMDTFYSYDANGRLTAVNQGVQQRSFAYDTLGRLVSETHPESGTTAYLYDDNGNLTRKTDARGRRSDRSYDALNRPTAIAYRTSSGGFDGSPSLSYSYDTSANGVGRLARVAEVNPFTGSEWGSSEFDYDALGRTTRLTRNTLGINTFTSFYTYNHLGGVTVADYPDAPFTLEYEYDDQGRQTEVSGGGLVAATNYSFVYSGSSATERLEFPGPGVREEITYNNRLQPESRLAIQTSSPFNIRMWLGYDFQRPGDGANNGNVWQVRDLIGATPDLAYDYDFLNRITQVRGGFASWQVNYAYDRYGNRLSALPALGSPPSFVATSLSASPLTNRINGWSYDQAGNLTGDGQHNYQWDGEGRLTSVDSGFTASYFYDYLGRRVAKFSAEGGRIYHWDVTGEVLWEYMDGSSQRDTFRIFLNGRQVFEDKPGAGAHSVHTDHLGTARVKLDFFSGSPFSTTAYYPFGQEMVLSNPADTHARKFTGKERDAETGLDYFEARYFGSVFARFCSPDPVRVTEVRIMDPQGLNAYAYVRNSPIALVDPTGFVIDTSQLSEKDRKRFEKILAVANQQDADGNFVNPTLHGLVKQLQEDKRVFVIRNTRFKKSSRGGKFSITGFVGEDFNEAIIDLDFKKIKSLNQTLPADLVPGFNKFEGLLGGGRNVLLRQAEVLGHEAAHASFALKDPAQAVALQRLINSNMARLAGTKYPLPPDFIKKLDQQRAAVAVTEKFAQAAEQTINKELQASKKKKK